MIFRGCGVVRRLSWLSAAALIAAASLAQAQPAPAPTRPASAKSPADAPKTVEGVVVTGAPQQGLRTSIDRRSYSLANDLQAATGSVADALRNVPSVEVDPQGNLTLRGDANVTIMIDGKPSGMFKGDNRGNALQQLPADRIDRVEVITNPSAAFDPDGAAGIINLITKKGRGAGASGAVRANLGDAGRKNAGVSGTYNSDKLSLNADAAIRWDVLENLIADRRTILDPATGVSTESSALSHGTNRTRQTWVLHGAVDYDLDPKTRLSGEVRQAHNGFTANAAETYAALDSAAAAPRRFDRTGRFIYESDETELTANLVKTFAGDGHVLTVNVRRDDTFTHGDRAYRYLDGPPTPTGLFEDLTNDVEQVRTELKAEYKRPMPGEAKLTAGYQLQVDNNDYPYRAELGPAFGNTVPEPALINRFLYDQTVNSLYATYERPLGKLTVLAGLRLEDVKIKTDQVTTGQSGHNDYDRAYPSLHLAWDLGDNRQLTASYVRRIQRPNPYNLNPFPIQIDRFTLFAGNPHLMPQQTDAYEVGWQYKSGATYYLATAYFREHHDVSTSVVRDLGGGVLLSTSENLGTYRNAGLELVANGRLTPKLTYNVSGNLYWNQIDAAGLGFPGAREAYSIAGRGNLNWQATPKDFFQANAYLNAKGLTPQGRREPWAGLNLGYRHKFDERLAGVVTVQDVLKSVKVDNVIDTPLLHETIHRDFSSRAVYVGLTYAFGANTRKPKEPAFDFGGGAPTP